MKDFLDLLGRKVRDRVTRLEGVVSSVSFDLYGCVQVIICPVLGTDGKFMETYWMDWKRIEIIESGRIMPAPNYESPGKEIGAASKPVPRS